ncbi:MAG TPA: hypothetical protein VG942_01980 [Hyphomonadaceae bacterium]|nr:hypothetical protein [Hyphomonadaceae bacterium]
MIIIADPKLNAVRQLNGLASWWDGQHWRHKPIGYLRTDRLRGYDTQTHPRTYLPINGAALGSRSIASAVDRGSVRILADKLSAADVEIRLAPALAALHAINSLTEGPEGGSGLPYPFLGFGPNSNSFFSTLLRAMQLEEPRFSRPARLAPGAGKLLLSHQALDNIRQGRSLTSGSRNSVIAAAIASTPASVG